jgi:hypothetical protein
MLLRCLDTLDPVTLPIDLGFYLKLKVLAALGAESV